MCACSSLLAREHTSNVTYQRGTVRAYFLARVDGGRCPVLCVAVAGVWIFIREAVLRIPEHISRERSRGNSVSWPWTYPDLISLPPYSSASALKETGCGLSLPIKRNPPYPPPPPNSMVRNIS